MRRLRAFRPAAVGLIVVAVGAGAAWAEDERPGATADSAAMVDDTSTADDTTTATSTTDDTTTATSDDTTTSTSTTTSTTTTEPPAPTATPTATPTPPPTEPPAATPTPTPPPPPPPGLRVASLPPSPPPPLPPPAPLASSPARRASPSGFRFAIEEDNDGISLARPRTDVFYTQGLRLSARWSTGIDEDGTESQVGVAVAQKIYTPSNLETTDLDVLRHDRPYAGWLYGALLLRTVEGAPGLRLGADRAGDGEGIFEVELAVGVTGPQSEAGALQTRAHELLAQGGFARPRVPAGWDVYQIANQVTFDTALRYRFDALEAAAWLGGFTRGTGSTLALRVSPRGALNVGTTRDAVSLGLEVRTGLMASRAGPRGRLPFELWLLGGADGSYVAYDGLIQGPLRYGVTTEVRRVPWVATLQAGAGLRLGFLEVAYRQSWVTAEISPAPPGVRALHRFGQLTVAFGAR